MTSSAIMARFQNIIRPQALAQYEQWTKDAVKKGGPDNKIIVGHPEAKKLIYDTLYDEMCPMTITENASFASGAVSRTIPALPLKEWTFQESSLNLLR